MADKYAFVLSLEDIDIHDIAGFGKRTTQLGELKRAGFPLLPGFAITNHAYQHFLHENNLTTRIKALLTTVHYDDIASLMQVSNLIKDLIMKAHFSAELIHEIDDSYKKLGGLFHHAVVTINLSQQTETSPITLMNIQGEANLILNIREAWSALFSPKELRNRQHNLLKHFDTSVTLLVQQMISPDVSGTILTRNEITQDKNTMLIEAMYGFPDTVGRSDQYTINKEDLTITNKILTQQETMLHLNGKEIQKIGIPEKQQGLQKLSDNLILEIAVLAKKIEKKYYFPQIISWSVTNQKLFITQRQELEPASQQKKEAAIAPSKYLPLLLTGTPAAPGLKKGHVRIIHHEKELQTVHSGDIVVLHKLDAQSLPFLKKAAAVITEQGGHIAMTTRLGIPAITSATQATKVLSAGTIVTVNGTTGEIHAGTVPTKPHDGIHTATKLYVTINDFENAEKISQEEIDGIGQLRSDHLLEEIGIHPQKLFNEGKTHIYTKKLSTHLAAICKSFASRPVIYSFTDMQTPQLRNLEGGKSYEPIETNPLLGFRGTYRMMHTPRLFAMELESIKEVRDNHISNLWLSIPFVRTAEEINQCKKLLTAAGLHRTPTCRLWITIATPAALMSIESFIETGIDGVIFDLDSIISLLLGIDKNNTEVIKEWNPHNPAITSVLHQAVKLCDKHHVPVSLIGKTITHYPSLIEQFIHWGVMSLSVEPEAIYTIREKITEAERVKIENKKN